ncbi:hypothetical protein [Calycomorphotria hydatis]|uniref:Uncharacterized protein n=1 Tax=Calycomorphotria hydatis TaxID=2528027 RepID=A0A517TDL4_9PLAN|nr:hypothetical protein [Calycomorphotria hydatis]QDT66463.1 hypothetical protein V22_37300 [Calycomorphotria hydatis]
MSELFANSMANWVYWGIGLAAGVFLLQYTLGPILVYLTQRMNGDPTIRTFDPSEKPPPKAVSDFFDKQIPLLEEIGFEVADYIVISDLVPKVRMIFVLCTNRETEDMAIAVCAFAMMEGVPTIQDQYVEFAAEFLDGPDVSTNNNKNEPAMKKVPHKVIAQFHWIKDARELFRIHTALIRDLQHGPKRPIPPDDELLEVLRADILKEFENQVPVGWMQYNETTGYYSPTLLGACLMTWKLCWPVASIRRAARRREGNERLRDWGLDELAG